MLDIFISKKLKEEIEDLKQSYKFLEEKFEKEKKDRIRALNDLYLKSKETDLLKSKCEILEEDKVKLEKEVSNLKGKNLNLQAEVEKAKSSLEESISNLQTKNFTLEAELKEEKSSLIKEISDLKDKIEREKKEKNNALSDLYHKNNEINILELKYEEIEKNISILEEEKSSLKNETLSLKDLELKLLKKMSCLKEENLNFKSKKSTLEKELSKLQAKNFDLEEQLKKERERKENLRPESESNDKKSILEKEISYLKEKNWILENQLDEEKSKLEEIVSKLKEKNLILENQLRKEDEIHEELKIKVTISELKYKKEKDYNIEITKQLESYKEKLKIAEKSFEKLSKSENSLEIEEKDKSEEIEEVKEIKEIKEIKEESTINVEKEVVKRKIKNENIDSPKLKWNNYNEFLKNENKLLDFLKTFSKEDIKDIYLQAIKREIIKKSQEKYFFNIFTRIKLNLPLTKMDLEKIVPFYRELIGKLKEENAFIVSVTDELCVEDRVEETVLLKDDKFEQEKIEEEPILKETENTSAIEAQYVEDKEIKELALDEIGESAVITDPAGIDIVPEVSTTGAVEPMPVTDVPYDEESVIEEVYTFDKILSEGLKSGEVSTEELQKIDYEAEEEVSDIYEAIEILEERGIIVNY
ncbi:hypothetical protein [uncultured Fusobacterium sp.]|uniref:hypothetical protein n=1 Tax=uncultured Fusobacterium sp. TaxID=159267 RepID=UPI0025F2BB0A|nr:hypothetical protein [uncultured Fusobacterium sp.]